MAALPSVWDASCKWRIDLQIQQHIHDTDIDLAQYVMCGWNMYYWTGRYSPDNREEDGSTAQQINENEDLCPHRVLTLTLLRLIYYDLGNIGKNLNLRKKKEKKVHLLVQNMKMRITCRGMTMMKIFLSRSERMCLTKVHPEPMRTTVIKRSVPFILRNHVQPQMIRNQRKTHKYVM